MRSTRNTLIIMVVLAISATAAGGTVTGWRTDGTGLYPDATPLTAWSLEEGLVWKTPFPNWSNALPVIVDGRVFTCAEPSELVCLDRDTGEIIWNRSNPLDDALSPEQIAEREANQPRMEELEAKIAELKNLLLCPAHHEVCQGI